MQWYVKILLGVVAIVMVWFVGRGAYEFFSYWRLNATAPAYIDSMEVVQLSSSKFAYSVSYHFDVEGKCKEGKRLLSFPIYPNRYAAEGELKKWRTEKWTVYFVSGRPQINSLERSFPWKSSLYALISFGIFIYFLFFFLCHRQNM